MTVESVVEVRESVRSVGGIQALLIRLTELKHKLLLPGRKTHILIISSIIIDSRICKNGKQLLTG